MESTERAYYQALFHRDFAEARLLYRLIACTNHWSAERVQREGHKCGLYDEASECDPWAALPQDAPAEITETVETLETPVGAGLELVAAG